MGHRAVVALKKVVDDVLPVRLDVIGEAVREFKFGNVAAVILDFPGKRAGPRSEWRRIVIEIDEHESRKLLKPHLLQLEFIRLEAFHLLLANGGTQAAIGVIGPGVVGAGDDVGLAAAFQQLVGAMRADIVECPENAVMPTHNGNALIGDLAGREGARLRHLAHMTGVIP